MLWLDPPEVDSEDILRFSETYCRTERLARVVAARICGLPHREAMERFLEPLLKRLADPFSVSHLEAAARRLSRAINNRERIVVLGDYDVDGVSSTCLLVSLLQYFGANPSFTVPRRLEEGYGLTDEVLDRAFKEGGGKPDLFIALDCGTNAQEEISRLLAQKIDVIVVDHHQKKEGPDPDFLMINPHLYDPPDAPWRNACTVGLVFKWMHGLLKVRREEGDPAAFEYRLSHDLDLVALGTVADLVPLQEENRILVHHGLKLLSETGRPGLVALKSVAGVNADRPLETTDISFKLGPRINACGRLEDAATPIRLLLSQDPHLCLQLASELNTLNSRRQEIEKVMANEAEILVDSMDPEASGLVVFDDDWHPGVVGIVASRLTRHFQKPTLVLGREGRFAKGSGRSVSGIDLVAALQMCAPLLDSWGGHPMAVGVSLPLSNLDAFRDAFRRAIDKVTGGVPPEETLQIEGWLSPDTDLPGLVEDQDILAPFGMGNQHPVLGIQNYHLASHPEVFGQGHIRFFLHGFSRGLSVVGWNFSRNMPPVQRTVDLALRFGWNFWNGRKIPQAELVDWRFSP